MFNILSIIKTVTSTGISMAKGWQKRKTVKLESDLAIAKAKTDANIEKIKTGQVADIAWEKTSLEQSGWKDEYWTIVLSIPMVMCFIPGLVAYVTQGFAALQLTPPWYKYAIGLAIGGAFGVKTVVNFMTLRKGQ